MTIIPVTTDTALSGEHSAIILLLEQYGVERLHVRKPNFTLQQMRQWLVQIPAHLHCRLRLHDHFDLAGEFAVGGLHLNTRNSLPPKGYNGLLSISCHSFAQIANCTANAIPVLTTPARATAATIPTSLTQMPVDVFLSPIFNSISKTGYKSDFSVQELTAQMGAMSVADKRRIIALGGITPQNIVQVYHLGFGGAAVIGSLWQRYTESKNLNHLVDDYTALKNAINTMGCISKIHIPTVQTIGNNNLKTNTTTTPAILTNISRLPKVMFITHATEKYDYIQSAELALKGGIKWVQYRHKPPVTKQEQQAEISAIAALCKRYGALLTINDHPILAVNADGLHVGLRDTTVAEARLLLGEDKIIGGTANTFEHIKQHIGQGANYVGAGPFRFTETKENLSPVLGLDGYTHLVEQCRLNNINIPIYAIGGIRMGDIKPVFETGVYGIAVSSLILQAENPVEAAAKIVHFFESNSQARI
jgi:thiamine-phosphate pyrophosphorylase